MSSGYAYFFWKRGNRELVYNFGVFGTGVGSISDIFRGTYWASREMFAVVSIIDMLCRKIVWSFHLQISSGLR